jgi:uncharacterized protein YhdP
VNTAKNTLLMRVAFSTQWDLKEIERWLKIPLTSVAQGATEITGTADFSLNAPIEVKMHSKLEGITVNLPEEYAKKKNTQRDFSLLFLATENQPMKLKLQYGDLLHSALLVDRQKEKYHLIAANIYLGKGQVDWPIQPGLYITGDFAQLDVEKIKGYLHSSNNKSNNTMLYDLKLRGIDIRTRLLTLLGQHLTQVHLQLTSVSNDWNININSAQVIGQVQLPMQLGPQETVSAHFQKLNLFSSTETNSLVDVKSLPSIFFTADNVNYNNMPLGRMVFKTLTNARGLKIQRLSITSARINLQATGDWLQADHHDTTYLQGDVDSSQVSNLLYSFGFDAHNFVSNQGKLNFALNWADAPYAPSLAHLKGKAKLELGPGRVVEIGEGSGAKMDLGRMLSIFSLQSLPRRLSLDFSDVFQKGYSFDSVRGDFVFQNGSAYTNNLRFNGPVASVGIDGRIGLKNKDYDFTLIVTPYVTASLPVAAAVMGGPWIGLAAFAVNTVLGSQVSKVTAYYYSVTGTWANPVWKAVQAR